MSILVSILGLAVLILIHEAGHFFAARWVGMRPRKFYIGFGAPIAKTKRNGVEYGIGSIPLGGYVKIPGMQRPAPGDLRKSLSPADQERLHEHLERLDEAIERGDWATARTRLADLEPHLGQQRMFQELDGALAEDAYWRQATWRRITAIAAGPATNILLAIVLFAAIFMTGTVEATRTVDKVLPGRPAAAAGLQRGDRILRVAGDPVTPTTISKHINATEGRPFTIVVKRDGKRVVVGPLRAQRDQGVYRVGFQIRGVSGPGESPPRAVVSALGVTWDVTAQTVQSIGRLVTGEGTRDISSSVGIVKSSSDAFKQSFQDFLGVMGLISLALALLNLLPVLPLDGGHIVMALLEKVRGRSFSQAVYMRYAAIGFAIFALLLYFGLRNDIANIGG
jgi:regulator of sigma E protease